LYLCSVSPHHITQSDDLLVAMTLSARKQRRRRGPGTVADANADTNADANADASRIGAIGAASTTQQISSGSESDSAGPTSKSKCSFFFFRIFFMTEFDRTLSMPSNMDHQYTSGETSRWQTVFRMDLRSLALFRMWIGIVICIDLVFRYMALEWLYSDDGILRRRDAVYEAMGEPRFEAESIGLIRHFPYTTNPYFLFGDVHYVFIVWLVHFVAGVCFMIGYRARIAAPILWYLHRCITLRTSRSTDMADNLLIMMLFWCMFCPISHYFSVDSALETARRFQVGGRASSPKKRVLWYGIGSIGLILQPVIMYVLSGWEKIGDKLWDNGDAIFFITNRIVDGTFVSHWLHDSQLLPVNAWRIMTHSIVWGELLVPLLLLAPWKNRICRFIGWLLLEILQIGMFTTMYLSLFPFLSFSSVIPTMPDDGWKLLRYLARTICCCGSGSGSSAHHKRIVLLLNPNYGTSTKAVCVLYEFILRPVYSIAGFHVVFEEMRRGGSSSGSDGDSERSDVSTQNHDPPDCDPWLQVRDGTSCTTNAVAVRRLLTRTAFTSPMTLVFPCIISAMARKGVSPLPEQDIRHDVPKPMRVSVLAGLFAWVILLLQLSASIGHTSLYVDDVMPHHWGVLQKLDDWSMMSHTFQMYTGLDNKPDFIFAIGHDATNDMWVDARVNKPVKQWIDTAHGSSSVSIERINLFLESVIDDERGIMINGTDIPSNHELLRVSRGLPGVPTAENVRGYWKKRVHYAVQRFFCTQTSPYQYDYVYLGRVFEHLPDPGQPRDQYAHLPQKREILFRVRCLDQIASFSPESQRRIISESVYGPDQRQDINLDDIVFQDYQLDDDAASVEDDDDGYEDDDEDGDGDYDNDDYQGDDDDDEDDENDYEDEADSDAQEGDDYDDDDDGNYDDDDDDDDEISDAELDNLADTFIDRTKL
jgi:uncharacterized membrane protein YphA (DoxX/SURF4 family)